MLRAAAWCLSRLHRLRWFAPGLCAAGLGCASAGGGKHQYPELYRPSATAGLAHPAAPEVQTVAHVEKLPAPQPAVEARMLPVTLDAVFRLAEQSNSRLGLARERLNESMLAQEQSCRAWLPQVYAGLAYYRHEGGIQDFTGQLIHSSTQAVMPGLQLCTELDLRESTFRQLSDERKVWQHKAELAQVNHEVLLDAATTYMDLLTARRAVQIARDLEQTERKLLGRVEPLARSRPEALPLLASTRATLSHRQHMLAQLQQQGNAAAAKLAYLLGLPPGTQLVPVDTLPVPIELVDSTPPASDLVAQALAGGPGVRELEGMLAVIQNGLEKSYGAHNLLPTVQLNLFEGPFGAGPGADLAWDNRLDIGVQLRWNLTQLMHTEHQRRLARSKLAQAQWSYEDLRGKLAAGVQEAKDAIAHGREQIGLATAQIKHASEAYRRHDDRLPDAIHGATGGEVLLSVRGVEQAHFNYLKSVSEHNKAQVRLLLLLGGGPKDGPPVAPCPGEKCPAGG